MGVINFGDEPGLKSKISAFGPSVRSRRRGAFLGLTRRFHAAQGKPSQARLSPWPLPSLAPATAYIRASQAGHWPCARRERDLARSQSRRRSRRCVRGSASTAGYPPIQLFFEAGNVASAASNFSVKNKNPKGRHSGIFFAVNNPKKQIWDFRVCGLW